MLDVQSLSSVGVGTYRMSSSQPVHFQALKTAVEHGYNLIDTATNYCAGTAEELIGDFIQAHPQYRDQLFLISKVGYLPTRAARSAALVAFLQKQDMAIAQIADDFEYSLDPAFIAYQLEQSLAKVGRDYLDVYLLHNPERFLQSQNLNQYTDLYPAIAQAFAYLETQVAQGKIRYYGVSSNHLFDPTAAGSLDCQRLLQIAQSIQADHHFKFIQFPFNFKEREALAPHYQGQSLLELAKANGLVTIGNRPLNMDDNGLEFRLVTHEAALENWDASKASSSLEAFVAAVDEQIKVLTDQQQTAQDFEPMVLLQQHFANFQGREAVARFFQAQIVPFVGVLFEEDPDGWQRLQPLQQAVEQQAHYHALHNQTQRTQTFLGQVQQEGIPLQANSVLTACHAYIHHFKLDHVLLGLRKPAYVQALQRHLIHTS